MGKNSIIEVYLFGMEIGKLGYDVDKRSSYFQYHPDFLDSGRYPHIFPYIIKRIPPVQVFDGYEGETFRGLPPMFADSLPDRFGNIIFKAWQEETRRDTKKITPLEQLCYVANRGMGALEYQPAAQLPPSTTIDIQDMVDVLKKVLDLKKETSEKKLSDLSLLNIFKIGTSAGGAHPKILISEHKKTGEIIPGDIEYSDDYNHYVVKLCLNDTGGKNYNEEKIEYGYYLMAQQAGIQMMPSKLIDNTHFAMLRYDRQNGKKQHVLTASGLTGWDFKKPDDSSYENLFKLAFDLKVPHKDMHELFRRMVFNVVFANVDDHLKNHSFIYKPDSDSWNLAPAYDLTYPLNVNFNYTAISRALSINHKRADITMEDIMTLAEEFVIKNPKGIINDVQQVRDSWETIATGLDIPHRIRQAIQNEFVTL